MSKVCINIITSWPSQDDSNKRISLLKNGGIRCLNNELVVNCLSSDPRRNDIPSNWNWYTIKNKKFDIAYMEAIIKGWIPDDCDFIVFCDDDSFTNIDHLAERCSIENDSDPIVWESDIVWQLTDNRIRNAYLKYTNEPTDSEKYKSTWSFGCECSVINKKFLHKLYKNKKIIKSMRDLTVSGEISGPDVQIPFMKHLINGARSIHTGGDRSTYYPIFNQYSGLVKNGNFWHVHFTTRHNLINHEGLIHAVKNGPHDSALDMTGLIFNDITRINSNKSIIDRFIGKIACVGIFWPWWSNWGRYVHNPVFDNISKIIFNADNTISDINNPNVSAKWNIVKDSVIIHNLPGVHAELEFKYLWKNECLIGNIVGAAAHNSNYHIISLEEKKSNYSI